MKSTARIVAIFSRSAARGTEQGRTASAAAAVRRAPRAFAVGLTFALALALSVATASAAEPSLSVKPITAHSITTAHVEGIVTLDTEANGGYETYYYFQYRPAGTEEWITGAYQGPLYPTDPPEAVDVEDNLTSLSANTEYEVRLGATVYSNFAEPRSLGVRKFTTDPAGTAPVLTVDAPGTPTFTTEQISGAIDPEGGNIDPVQGLLAIPWELQINREGGGWEFAEGGVISNEEPEGGGTPPAETTDPIAVAKNLEGLAPGATYKFRVRALYAGTEALSAEGEFTTLAVPPPTLTTDDASSVTGTSAHFSGTVDIADVDPIYTAVECRFEYVTDAQFLANGFSGASRVGCNPGTITGEDTVSEPAVVMSDAKNLVPQTAYHFRLFLRYQGGTVTQDPLNTFQTAAAGPTAVIAVNSPEGPGEATIRGYVDPKNSAVSDCHFVYGATTAYGNTAPCETTPTGNQPVTVSALVSDLPPGTVGHYRVLVETAAGSAESEDSPFAVPAEYHEPECANADKPGASRLPDCRAWEMVSPPDKNGADIAPMTSRVHAAAEDGPGHPPMAAMFASLGAFADARGISVSADYLSQRLGAPGTTGWSTHAVTPPQEPLPQIFASFSNEAGYDGYPSPDLTVGLFRSFSPVTDDPSAGDFLNLYRRDDLRDPGPGSYSLLTTCLACQAAEPPTSLAVSPNQKARIAARSSDLHHVIFESRLNFTSDAGTGNNVKLYKSDDGALRLIKSAPNCPAVGGAAKNFPCSAAGFGATQLNNTSHTISADGSRVLFASPVENNGGPSQQTGTKAAKLYLFDDQGTSESSDDTTVQINASERAVPEEAQIAQFQTASADLSRVFFTTGERLTEDAPSAGGEHLYMYDAGKPAGARLSLLDAGPDLLLSGGGVSGVIGASEDGHYVYFLASGQRVKGAKDFDPRLDGIYLWRDTSGASAGTVSFVSGVEGTDGQANVMNLTWTVFPQTSRISPDGLHLLFELGGSLGPALGKNHGTCTEGSSPINDSSSPRPCSQLYVYSASTDSLACASCNPDGAPVNPSESYLTFRAVSGTGAASKTYYQNHALSDDGRRVFFSTGDALVSEDTNGKSDAYEYDVTSGIPRLLSSGTSRSDTYFMDASRDGDDVFFTTHERLVGWDFDGNIDLYDARVGGGFPEPPAVTAPCSGDSCKSPPLAPPGASPASSSSFSGPGDTSPRRCAKGRRAVTVKGKTRCVASRKHKARKRANHNGRAGR